MTYLLSVDPGKTTGMAVFKDKDLCDAYYGMPEDMLNEAGSGAMDLAVIEMPRWYPHEHKIDVNDLLDLSVTVGRFQETLRSQGAKVELVFPRTWKGTVKKDIHNRRVLEQLTAAELALLPKRPRAKDFDHNMIDAIGLGLWKLGRKDWENERLRNLRPV